MMTTAMKKAPTPQAQSQQQQSAAAAAAAVVAAATAVKVKPSNITNTTPSATAQLHQRESSNDRQENKFIFLSMRLTFLDPGERRPR